MQNLVSSSMLRALLGLLLQTLGELSGVSGGKLDSEAQIDGVLQQKPADSKSCGIN